MDHCPMCGAYQELAPELGDPRKELKKLDSDIAQLQLRIKELRRKKVPFKRRINRLVAPVLRLPPEITSEIFLAYLQAAGDSWKELYAFQSPTPLTFGTICSAWRDLAWSMPWLWNSIAVNLDCYFPAMPGLIKQWLERSGHRPLSIHLVCGRGYEGDKTFDVLDTISCFTHFSDRWYYIDFDMPAECVLHFPWVRGCLPILTSMVLHSDDWSWDYSVPEAFSVAPRLETVTLCGDQVYLDGFTIPIHQLTALSTPVPGFEQCVDALRRASRLRRCVLSDISHSEDAPLVPVVAPLLEWLEVSLNPSKLILRPFSDLIDALTLPSIRTLIFDTPSRVFPHNSFVSLINRSSCSLTHLRLESVSISDPHLLECLRVVPSLTKLELRHAGTTDARIQMLNLADVLGQNSNGNLVPNLQILNCLDNDLDMGIIANMLRSRRNPTAASVPRLLSATIDVVDDSDEYDNDALTILQGLVDDGMDLSGSLAIPLLKFRNATNELNSLDCLLGVASD